MTGAATRDHPRSRGVYNDAGDHALVVAGSSPLARGLLSFCGEVNLGARIIPARAGFTWPRHRFRRSRRDHPRSRGVYQPTRPAWAPQPGSSPLARGLPPTACSVGGSNGIIPARAGFTPLRTRSPDLRQDHPRSRGVYTSPPAHTAFLQGSSPLARGLQIMLYGYGLTQRIIPARAGFTTVFGAGWAKGADHPRSRGVYSRKMMGGGSVSGSSPLARGLLAITRNTLTQSRIIPARAGFTFPDSPTTTR